MGLILYGHPFSSYTQKVLIPLYENSTPFEFRSIDAETPEHSAEWLARWPLAKFPILVDDNQTLAEASIIIEYLHLNYPGPVPLLSDDPMTSLDIRFLDRFFDLHVMDPVQVAVDSALMKSPLQKEVGLSLAQEKLERAYSWLEQHLSGKVWATGRDFSLADCAAAPSLFYADWVQQVSESYPNVTAYRQRLLDRPSFARAIEAARPFRSYFPLGAPDRD